MGDAGRLCLAPSGAADPQREALPDPFLWEAAVSVGVSAALTSVPRGCPMLCVQGPSPKHGADTQGTSPARGFTPQHLHPKLLGCSGFQRQGCPCAPLPAPPHPLIPPWPHLIDLHTTPESPRRCKPTLVRVSASQRGPEA